MSLAGLFAAGAGADAGRDNRVRWVPGDRGGHVESYFLKANALDRPLAFWIKFTILSPEGRPEDAVAESWAIVFDRASGRGPIAVKETFPAAQARLEGPVFETPSARLEPGATRGRLRGPGGEIEWDLAFEGEAPPLHLFPSDALYETRIFPRSKRLTPPHVPNQRVPSGPTATAFTQSWARPWAWV